MWTKHELGSSATYITYLVRGIPAEDLADIRWTVEWYQLGPSVLVTVSKDGWIYATDIRPDQIGETVSYGGALSCRARHRIQQKSFQAIAAWKRNSGLQYAVWLQ